MIISRERNDNNGPQSACQSKDFLILQFETERTRERDAADNSRGSSENVKCSRKHSSSVSVTQPKIAEKQRIDGLRGIAGMQAASFGRQRGPFFGINVHDLPEASDEASRGGLDPNEKEIAEFEVERRGWVSVDVGRTGLRVFGRVDV